MQFEMKDETDKPQKIIKKIQFENEQDDAFGKPV